MASALAWLFNNPQQCDVTIAITSGASTAPPPASHDGASSSNAPACNGEKTPTNITTNSLRGTQRRGQQKKQGTQSESRTKQQRQARTVAANQPVEPLNLHGHTLVLNSYSDYFRALASGNWEPKAGSKRARSEEGDIPVIQLLVSEPGMVPLAETMVKYMYSEELPAGLDVEATLKLLVLADEYGVMRLVTACTEALGSVASWHPKAWLQVMQLPDCVKAHVKVKELVKSVLETVASKAQELVNASEASSQQKPAAGVRASSIPGLNTDLAKSLLDCVFCGFLDLEAVLNDAELQSCFVKWPATVVESLLSRDDLKVSSESVVLVAAVTWISCNAFVSSDYHQVTSTVRLPQLCPFYMALVVATQPPQLLNAHLPPTAKALLGMYLASDEDARRQLEKSSNGQVSICRLWGQKRRSVPAEGAVVMRIPDEELKDCAGVMLNYTQKHMWRNHANDPGLVGFEVTSIRGVFWKCALRAEFSDNGERLANFVLSVTPSIPACLPLMLYNNVNVMSLIQSMQFEVELSIKDGSGGDSRHKLSCGYDKEATVTTLWKDVNLQAPMKKLGGLVKDSEIRVEVAVEMKAATVCTA